VIIAFVALLCVWLWANWSSKKFYELFTEPMLLTECEPKEIVPHIEKTCGVEIPNTAKDILAAKNIGSWDSSERDFVLRFLVNSEHIADFVKSLPGDIVKKEYSLNDDSRKSKQLNQSAWFIEPILEGTIIEGVSAPDASGVIELMYIDTSKPEESLIYIMGSYVRTNEKDLSYFDLQSIRRFDDEST
jgi:hypothetical protein